MNEIEIFTLANGMRCIHRRTDSPIAYISLTIGSGTRDELESQNGVAHLVEHLMFKGTAKRSAYKVNSILESVGGELNAFTTKEDTVLNATCLTEYTAKAVDLLQDMAFNSIFTLGDIDKEREVIIDEINSYKDSPAELIFDDFEELLFKGSGLGRNILGSKKDLKRIVRSDIVNFTTQNYKPYKMVLAASTSMSCAKFRALCDKVVGGIAAIESVDNERQAPALVAPFDISANKHSYQTHTLIGGYAYSAFDERRLPLSLLLNILGGPSSMSRLNMSLREKHALTYSTEASYTPFVDSGLFTLYFSAEEVKSEKAERLLRQEMEKMQSSAMKAAELDRWKKQFMGQLLLSSQNIEQSMMSIAKSILLYNRFDTNEQIIEKIKAIDSEQILTIAQEIFAPKNIAKLTYR